MEDTMLKGFIALVVALILGLAALGTARAEDYIDCGCGGGGYYPQSSTGSYGWGVQYNWVTGEYNWVWCYDPGHTGTC